MGIVVFFLPMIVSLIITLLSGIHLFKRTKNILDSLMKSIGLNLLITALAAFWWFNYESDGFSQIFGLLYYGIAFLVISIIGVFVVTGMSKRSHQSLDK
jgi:hypothetical protein